MEWNLKLLMSLEWKRFEEICKEYLIITGSNAKLTKTGADGGIDIEIYQDNEITGLVQCKAWSSIVGVKEIRELNGVMKSENIEQGYFMTTSSFSPDALIFGQKNNISLIDGKELIKKITALTKMQQIKLLNLATEGDYTTPTCPNCDQKMIRKTANNSGKDYWNCIKCKHSQKTRKPPPKKEINFFIGKIISAGVIGIVMMYLAPLYVERIFKNMGNKMQETTRNTQVKMPADMTKGTREAQIQLIEQKAQQEANIEAAKEQARKMEMERFKREIAEHQAQESKKAEFEKQFKPREECNDPMLEWSKSVQCNNEKMTAKEKFYSSH